MSKLPLDIASLAQVGSFFNNSDGAILHNISADLRSQGRLEMEMRAANMRKLQKLEWGFILDNPKLRYVYGEKDAGQKVGLSFKEREQFLNSIGVETIELSTVEIAALEKAQATIGKHIIPMTEDERKRIYSKVKNPYSERVMDICNAMKEFNFIDLLEAWTFDEERRLSVDGSEYDGFAAFFYSRFGKDIKANEANKRIIISKMCILLSIFLQDLYKSDTHLGSSFIYI